jgi:hypothetical protein
MLYLEGIPPILLAVTRLEMMESERTLQPRIDSLQVVYDFHARFHKIP